MSFAKLTKNAMRGVDTSPSITSFSSTSPTISDEGFNFKKIAMGLIAVVIIVMLILIVVHYTITPIFKIKKDGTGYIPVPGMKSDDGEIYWKESPNHGYLEEKDTILDVVTGCTFQMDIYLDDVNADINETDPRPLFLRYNPVGNLKPIDFSMGVFLAPKINDIHVIVRTSTQNSQIIVIKNLPPKTVVRIGVILGDNYYEAYKNGELVASRTFTNGIRAGAVGRLWGSPGTPVPGIQSTTTTAAAPPTTSRKAKGTPGFDEPDTSAFTEGFQDSAMGQLQATVGAAASDALKCNQIQGTGSLGGLMNLHIWNRILSPGELKFASPALPDKTLFTEGKESTFQTYLNKFLP